MNDAQWLAIQRLLEHKYSIQQINEILQLKIDENDLNNKLWIKKTKGELATLIDKYANVFTIQQAIRIAKENIELKKNIIQTLVKKSIYPIFLMILSFVLLLVFSQIILPQMIMIVEDTSSIQVVLRIVQIFVFTIIFCLLVCGCTGIGLIILYKNRTLNVKYLFHIQLIQDYISYELMLLLRPLLLYKISTFQSIDYLSNLTKGTLLQTVVSHLKELMMKGIPFEESIEQSMFSSSAKMYLLLGIRSKNLEFFLDTYFITQQNNWEQKIKKFNLRIQLLAYSMVGSIVFIVYQIMLMPLNMLQNL